MLDASDIARICQARPDLGGAARAGPGALPIFPSDEPRHSCGHEDDDPEYKRGYA